MSTESEKAPGDLDFNWDAEGLTITWADGTKNFYHHFFLRLCCECETCGSSHTGSRFLQPCDVPMDICPVNVDSSGGDIISIEWGPECHRTELPVNWLRDQAYSGDRIPQRRPHPILWDASINTSLPAVDFETASGDKPARMDMFGKLRDYGFVVVRNGPPTPEGIMTVAGLIGEVSEATYGNVFQLKVDRSAHTLGNTQHPVPPHTDEAYLHNPTGILVLHCIQPASDGGESVLVDGFKLASDLREQDPEAFRILSVQPQVFHRVVPDEGLHHLTRARVLTLDEQGDVVGFRFHTRTMTLSDQPAETVGAVHAANIVLSKMMLDDHYHARFQLQSGDAVVFDNHRVMHSRLGFSDMQRHLQICNVSRERFHQQLRQTANQLGLHQEASQIMAAGTSG